MDYGEFSSLIDNSVVPVYFKELDDDSKIKISIESIESIEIKYNEQNNKYAKIKGTVMSTLKNSYIAPGRLIEFSMSENSFKKSLGKFLTYHLYDPNREVMKLLHTIPLVIEITKVNSRMAETKILEVRTDNGFVPFNKFFNVRGNIRKK